MTPAKQVIAQYFPFNEYSIGEIERIENCMKEYARQALDEAAGKAEADVVWLNDDPPLTTTPDDQEGAYDKIDERYLKAGDQRFIQEELDFEVGIMRQSILKIKNELQ